MKFFISYNYKAFLINFHFLNIFWFAQKVQKMQKRLEKAFFTEKRFKVSNRQNAQKVLKRCAKKGTFFFHFTDAEIYENSILLFYFSIIWLSVKYKDFLIISNLSQTFQGFILIYKHKLESTTCLLCTTLMLYFF